MKHIFIVNPQAGGKDRSGDIAKQLESLDVASEMYVTLSQHDATRYVRKTIESLSDAGSEKLRFYACGGDGTLNEVVSGVLSAKGQPHTAVEVGCYPCGSGDDFVKNWPETNFKDLAALVHGLSEEVDVMSFNGHYSVNTLNYGFEAAVCRTMAQVRRKPLIGGRMAYTTGIVSSLINGRKNHCRVEVDGELWHEGDLLLLSLANGQFAGGGYHCAPRASVSDGLIEVMAIKPMSVLSFARLIKYYKNGELLDRPELRDIVSHRRGLSVTIDAGAPSFAATDGELVEGQLFEITMIPKAIRFIVPSSNRSQ